MKPVTIMLLIILIFIVVSILIFPPNTNVVKPSSDEKSTHIIANDVIKDLKKSYEICSNENEINVNNPNKLIDLSQDQDRDVDKHNNDINLHREVKQTQCSDITDRLYNAVNDKAFDLRNMIDVPYSTFNNKCSDGVIDMDDKSYYDLISSRPEQKIYYITQNDNNFNTFNQNTDDKNNPPSDCMLDVMNVMNGYRNRTLHSIVD